MDADPTLSRRLASRDKRTRARIVANMRPEALLDFDRDWREWIADAQRAPEGDWRIWLLLAGRGFGKTRAGAEWVNRLAKRPGDTRIALVGATIGDVRATMIEGESGLLAVSDARWRPVWEPSNGQLKWRSGAQAFVYSAENPDGLRGPAHDFAWCDELGRRWRRRRCRDRRCPGSVGSSGCGRPGRGRATHTRSPGGPRAGGGSSRRSRECRRGRWPTPA